MRNVVLAMFMSLDGYIAGAASLIEQGLIDQYRLLVSPWLQGGGIRLFDGGHPRRNLALVDATRFDAGSMLLTYRDGPPA